jgi:hypothetical protein
MTIFALLIINITLTATIIEMVNYSNNHEDIKR